MAVCRGVDNLDKISTFQCGFDGLDIIIGVVLGRF